MGNSDLAKKYEKLVFDKHLSPVYDLYAIFQPFNEAHRPIQIFSEWIGGQLGQNDKILCLWDRTGFTGQLVAGLFPHHQVVSHWHGGGVLAEVGFQHWLKTSAENWRVEHFSLEEDWPLGEKYRVIIGFDLIHRYFHNEFFQRLQNVLANDPILLFPHVHNANSQPEPYFEREGRVLPGEKILSEVQTQFPLHSIHVMSERDLFLQGESYQVRDQSADSHYNSCLLICPPSFEPKSLTRRAPRDEDFALANPFVRTLNGRVRLDENLFYGRVSDFGVRHPVYWQKMLEVDGLELEPLQCQILYLAKEGYRLGEIAQALDSDSTQFSQAVDQLEQSELLLVAPISSQMFDLQKFYLSQFHRPQVLDISALFSTPMDLMAEKTALRWCPDDSELSFSQCWDVIGKLASALKQNGLGPKSTLILENTDQHPIWFFLFWSGIHCGSSVALTRNSEETQLLQNQMNSVHVRDVFPGDLIEAVLDAVDEQSSLQPSDNPSFRIWLPSSGSSGKSKMIELDLSKVIQTASDLARFYCIGSSDTLLCTAAPHTMSGVRNLWILPLLTGATVHLVDLNESSQWVDEINGGVSVLSTAPPLISLLKEKTLSPKLKTVISTAMPLSEELKAQFEEKTKVPALSYYGLTETCGFCIGQSLTTNPDSIGEPVNTLIHLGDPSSSAVSEGALWLFSDRHYLRLITDDGEFKGPRSWWNTQDLASISDSDDIVLHGRIDRQICGTRGEKITAEKIEENLKLDPLIRQACILQYHQGDILEIVAVIETVEELETPEKHLAAIDSQFLPRHWITTDENLSLPSGKVDVAKAKQLMKRDFRAS